jgi:hypothetical protein
MRGGLSTETWERFIGCAFAAFLFILAVATTATAQCVQPPEEGSWRNADANTRSITRIQLRFICQDQVLNGVPCCPPGPPWYIHIYGKCHPTDCDWGEVAAREVTVGTSNYVFSVYYQSFATRYVYAKMSAYRPGQLWVWTYTDFADPNRPDYVSNNWFIKQ